MEDDQIIEKYIGHENLRQRQVRRRQRVAGTALISVPVLAVTILASWPLWWVGILIVIGGVLLIGCGWLGVELLSRSMD